ncbi:MULTISPECIES: DUF6105 family protein [unclassified Roseitalea]|uniref:DUF6105 family protein n=1 Tax=unclassified Roseitalea TaxID=2639107 RepID=UPI00274012D4|nr:MULTISPECIES: DUF6105 family protein [unclassified Roseitalea]
MRYVFWFWFVPMGFLWGWYWLSLNDISLGLTFFSRSTHDLVFAIYGQILGMEKEVIVRLLIKACIVDTFLIMGILAFRRRKAIARWWAVRREPGEAAQQPDSYERAQVSPAAE